MSKYGVWLRAPLPQRGKLRPKAEASSDHYGNIGEKQKGSKDTDRVNATTARSSDRNSVSDYSMARREKLQLEDIAGAGVKGVVVGNILTEFVSEVEFGGDQGLEVEGSLMQGIELEFVAGDVEVGPNVDCLIGPNEENQSYYQSLFQSSNPLNSDLCEATACLDKRIDEEMVEVLSRPFDKEDVRRASSILVFQ
ncbi:hypothetical protein ACOSP7_019531 [Xanthoceras sorbifolium]